MGFLFLFIALILNASANVLIKLGVRSLGTLKEVPFVLVASKVLTNYFLIIGLFLFAFNVIFYVIALSKINLSTAYPIMTTGGLLIISLFSVFYLKESLTLVQILGIILMAIGITLVAYHFR